MKLGNYHHMLNNYVLREKLAPARHLSTAVMISDCLPDLAKGQMCVFLNRDRNNLIFWPFIPPGICSGSG